MPSYKIKFFNRLCDGTGHERTVWQRSIEILGTPSEESAVECAQAMFAEAEQIGNWRQHAQFYEVERLREDHPAKSGKCRKMNPSRFEVFAR